MSARRLTSSRFLVWPLVWLLACLLSGCGADKAELAGLKTQLAALEQTQQQMLERLQLLEQVPELSFVISRQDITIEEQMFQPLLKCSGRLLAMGDEVPQTFYVDMLLQVEVPAEEFSAVIRQVFPVFDGKSQIELVQPLPVHGLKENDLKITLRPMNWYGSNRIEPSQVTYR
ncbi:MAG: hypothetical protein VYA55_00855 [Pseudomonadota bacterium]|nr:hypothetical protein [Pseudomonadota bacterium]